MKPFAEIADAALESVVGVACDLDDTLTRHGALTSSALASLYDLARAGIPCIVVTGRPLGWAEVLVRLLPVAAVVTENGGAWVVREGMARRIAFVDDDTTRLEGMTKVDATVEQITQRFPELKRVHDLTARMTDVALDIHEAANVPDDVVAAAKAAAQAAGLHAIASTVHLHVSSRVPDKVVGMRAAVHDIGLDASQLESRWIYVGDSPNDALAFRAIGISVGVANVRAFEGRMPHWPAFVTEGETGDGFAEVVRRLLSVRNTA